MPNHFHLLVREKIENGISLFMKKLLTGYSMYFNKKYERTGALFEGRFKAQHADNDEYLKYLFAYIHLNPVKLIEPKWRETGIQNRPDAENYLKQYTYSSYPEYIKQNRPFKKLLTTETFPNYFEDELSFQEMIKDWLTFKDQAS